MKSYFDTTNESESNVENYELIAKSQEDYVLNIFRSNPEMTASRIHMIFGSSVPITSIRRAITNLMNRGKLEKTEKRLPGIYGRKEIIYRLV